MTTQPEDLKPCPCCGGPAKAWGDEMPFHPLVLLCRVACETCGMVTANYRTRAVAFAAWNRRVPETRTWIGDLRKLAETYGVDLNVEYANTGPKSGQLLVTMRKYLPDGSYLKNTYCITWLELRHARSCGAIHAQEVERRCQELRQLTEAPLTGREESKP